MSTSTKARTITYREAIREALLADERVFLMGEDVGAYGGCFGVSKGLLAEFGPERFRDTQLSESAFVAPAELKEVLRNRQIRLENLAEEYALFPTATLTPEPIALDLKVVLVGSPLLYELAYMLDEDLRKLFRVKAEFDWRVPGTRRACVATPRS